MNQVGETKTFALSVTPPADSGVYSYVWKFWDGTVAVTATPRVEKTLNIGGDPNDSRKLYFTCQPVMEDGQSVVITGFVIVNNPPYVIPSPEITRNDDFFPYSTAIRLTAYDVEGDSLSFLYYNSGDVLLGGGVTTNIGPVNGTWNGTAASYTGFQNVFDGTISADSRIVLKICGQPERHAPGELRLLRRDTARAGHRRDRRRRRAHDGREQRARPAYWAESAGELHGLRERPRVEQL
jgi:hypothetical protein